MDFTDGSKRLGWLLIGVLLFAVPALGQNPNVTVDDQPTAEQRLEEVIALRRAARYDEAAELVQELIEASLFKLVAVGEGGYADVERWSRELLLRDGELREAYRERYTATSTRALAQAQASDERLADLLGVVRLYLVTRPGLEAGLSAAGLLLESGDASSAATLIESLSRHPDIDDASARLIALRGAAAAYTNDKQVLEDVADEMAELGLTEQATELKALAESIQPGLVILRPSQIDMGPKPTQIKTPLWDQPLSTSENAARWLLGDTSVLPVITPSFAMVNNGRQVLAMDRASGQRAWVYPEDADENVQRASYGQRWQDIRSVAVGEGVISAVLGECHGITENRNPYVPPNRLVCIDEQTGRLLWTRTSGVFLENEPTQAQDRRAGGVKLQYTHFVGTPIISRGVVYALLRRTKSEGDTHSTWLMAYDAEDSSLLWYRHLSLVTLNYTNRDSYRVSPQLTLHGDTLYVSDSLATVGAIEPSTGAYKWLRVLPVGAGDGKSITVKTRGIVTPPVMTSAGLLVPLALSHDRLVLIDPDDGAVLRSFREDPNIGKAEYLLDGADGGLVVSATAISYWDAEEAAVAWTYSLAPGETPQGRGDVSLRYVVVPTSQRLLVLDRESGKVIGSAEPLSGSIIVREGEMLAVAEGRLYAYTSWERVYDRLIQQIKDRPEDPSAGLSLASIATRQEGQEDSVLRGVDHALDAVARQAPGRVAAIRKRVFDQLRELTLQADRAELRRQLYDRMAMVTQTAEQEATYHLDAGLYFAEHGEPKRAVEHLHAVISEPAFAAVSYRIDGLERSASAIAQNRIQQLIENFGRGVYARQDALATVRVAQLKAADTIDAAALTAVARRFPLSPVAGRVLLDAADAYAEQGRRIDAASLYKQAVSRSTDDEQRQRAVGRLLSFYLQTGRPGLASDLLDRQVKQYPGLSPFSAQVPLSAAQWRKRIAQVRPLVAEQSPLTSTLGQPLLLSGRLIDDASGNEAAHDRKCFFLHHADNTITAHASSRPKQPLWSATAPSGAGEIELLADEDGQVLLWAPDVNVVFVLDAVTGEKRWQTPVRFDAPDDDQALHDQADPAGGGLLTAVSETVVCFGHRESAKLLAIDRAAGNVLWRVTLDMTGLTAIDADNWTLAAVGRAGLPQQLRSGKLALLDLSDAEPILDQGQLRIGLTPFAVNLREGRATIFGATGVTAIDADTGNALWSHGFSDKQLTGAHAVAGHLVAVETNDGEVHLLDSAAQGRPLGSVAVRAGGDRSGIGLQGISQRVWANSSSGVFCLGADPVLQWSDAIQTLELSNQALLVGRDHVVMIAQRDPDAVQDGLALFLFEKNGGRLIEQYTLGSFEQATAPRRAVLLGSGLAIPAGEQTLVIPGKAPAP